MYLSHVYLSHVYLSHVQFVVKDSINRSFTCSFLNVAHSVLKISRQLYIQYLALLFELLSVRPVAQETSLIPNGSS